MNIIRKISAPFGKLLGNGAESDKENNEAGRYLDQLIEKNVVQYVDQISNRQDSEATQQLTQKIDKLEKQLACLKQLVQNMEDVKLQNALL